MERKTKPHAGGFTASDPLKQSNRFSGNKTYYFKIVRLTQHAINRKPDYMADLLTVQGRTNDPSNPSTATEYTQKWITPKFGKKHKRYFSISLNT
jgi:hypothetical protein